MVSETDQQADWPERLFEFGVAVCFLLVGLVNMLWAAIVLPLLFTGTFISGVSIISPLIFALYLREIWYFLTGKRDTGYGFLARETKLDALAESCFDSFAETLYEKLPDLIITPPRLLLRETKLHIRRVAYQSNGDLSTKG